MSMLHFFKTSKNEKKVKKDLLIIFPVRNTVFHEFAEQFSSYLWGRIFLISREELHYLSRFSGEIQNREKCDM